MKPDAHFQLTSPAFAEGDSIPEKYSCKGQNIRPPLQIHGVPQGTASLAFVLHDPDAPHGDFLHWTVWNLNADLTSLPENELPDGAIQGTTGFGTVGYGGPCPPSGTHRYIFDLYALDTQLDVPSGAGGEDLIAAIQDHVVARTSFTGTFSAR